MAKKAPDPSLPKIHAVRRQKVVLDADLAQLYGVPTKQLNQAINRNVGKFPEDFCFLLSAEEEEALVTRAVALKSEDQMSPNLRSQIATLKKNGRVGPNLKSQSVTSSLGHGGRRKPVRVFTEHGALMAANVLRSERAVQMSLYLIRAFVALREQLVSNLATLLSEVGAALRAVQVVGGFWRVARTARRGVPTFKIVFQPLIGSHQGNR